MRSTWQLKPIPDHGKIDELAAALSITPLLARLLFHRGIDSQDAAGRYLEPRIQHLHDPFGLKGMDRAVARIIRALEENEGIGLFGDFDVDGITGSSLLYRFFQKLGFATHCELPSRLQDGYGLTTGAIDRLLAKNVSLLITVDCGITAVTQVAYANTLGMDCIVTDHHQPKDVLPATFATINPRQPGCDYPFKDLAGVGLAWKLADAVAEKIGEDRDMVLDDLDLVAVGSIADVAPVRDENRVLVTHGLEQLARSGKKGFRQLLEVAGLTGRSLSYGSIAFGMAPRINAVGRLGDAMPAFELLTTFSDDVARDRAAELDEVNKKRQALDARIFEEAMDELDSRVDPGLVVLASEEWHAGVIGIVASRVKEQFGRPAVLIALKDGMGRGSARSVPGFALHEALEECSDLVEQAGGHALAAGLVIRQENIPAFRERMQGLFNKAKGKIASPGALNIDAPITLDECSWETLEELDRMSPFGPGNERPLFLAEDVSVISGFRPVGKNHIKFLASQNGVARDCIAFQVGHHVAPEWNTYGQVDVAFALEENRWGGERRLQLNVRGVRKAEKMP